MKQSITTNSFVFFSMLLIPTLAFAEENEIQIKVSNTKPILYTLDRLRDEFHWRITFEEAPVLDKNELVMAPRPGSTEMRPILRNIRTVSLNIPKIQTKTGRLPLNEKQRIIESVFSELRRSGDDTEYRAIYDGDFIHIAPIAARGVDGKIKAYEPLMDTAVTIAPGRYRLGAFVSNVLFQVQQIRRVSIAEGTFSLNLFANEYFSIEASNEPAGLVLARGFEEVRKSRLAMGLTLRLFWNIGYSHSGEHFWFNASSLVVEEDGSSDQPIVADHAPVTIEALTPVISGQTKGGRFGSLPAPSTKK